MSRTKERRKAIQRNIRELATADRVPLAVREKELRNVARALQEAWGLLHLEQSREVESTSEQHK